MLRIRLTFKGAITAFLALLSFLVGGALQHPYLNLSGYALMTVLLVGGAMGTFAVRGVRIRGVAQRREPTAEADVWVSLEARRDLGPFGLDLDGNPGREVLVRAPDRVGHAFRLTHAPERLTLRLRALPLGLVEVMRVAVVTWLDPAVGEAGLVRAIGPAPGVADPDGQVREHRQGEGMRQVHWPLSARLQRLVVRMREREPEPLSRPAAAWTAGVGGSRDVRLDHARAFTLAATLGAIAFLWQQGALALGAVVSLVPLVVVGGLFSLRRAGSPSKPLLMALYVGILAILAWFVSDLREHVLSRGPIALTVVGIAALFAWDLRDRPYIRAQLFLVTFASLLLPAFFAPRDGQGSGLAFAGLMIALLLAAWAEGRHAIGATHIRLSELGSLTSAILPLGFFAAMVLLLHPWLPAVPLPSLPSFGLSPVRSATEDGKARMPGQEGRLDLDSRWPQGSAPVLEVRSRDARMRAEVFDTYRQGAWSASPRAVVAWPSGTGAEGWVRVTLRADAMRVLPLPPGAEGVRDALLDPQRHADGTFRLSRPAWIGYSYETQRAGTQRAGTQRAEDRDGEEPPPIPSERQTEGSPRELEAIAKRLAGDASTPLEALERIAQHLQTEMRYDLQAPEAVAGVDPVLYFLRDSRRGFCVHFASALALLGREIGVPTRVVGGYAGGHQAGDVTVFDERHAHAWVEAYVDGRWITLDPTPGGTFMLGRSADHGRIALALALLGGVGLALWRRRREPELVSRYRRMLERLRKAGVPVTEATTPREALDLARESLDAGAWEEFRDLVERYEAARFGGSV